MTEVGEAVKKLVKTTKRATIEMYGIFKTIEMCGKLKLRTNTQKLIETQ